MISDDNIPYIGYGIENAQSHIRIEDITTDYDKLHEWVDTINHGHISDLHIYDAVEDFLTYLSTN